MSNVIDNTGLFGQNPDKEPDTTAPDADKIPVIEDESPLFAVSLIKNMDGTTNIKVDGTPSLIEMQELLYRALRGVEVRISSETTCAMLAQMLGVGMAPMAIDPTQSN